MQQRFSTTYRRFGIRGGFNKQLLSYLLFSQRLSLHELLHLQEILVDVECYALPLSAISSGPTGFLIVTFERLGDIVVDYKSHIGFVNTHAKRDGGNDYIHFLEKERILIGRPGGSIHTGMIRKSLDVVYLQNLGEFLDLLSAQAVDYSALAGIGLDELDYVAVDIGRLGSHFVI